MNWFQALGPSLLIVLGGLLTWIIKSRIEELRAIEEKLRETRSEIYSQILAPYITLFSDLSPEGQAKVAATITSEEYRKTAFDLALLGSDAVIQAYNSLMSYTFQTEGTGNLDPKEMMRLWGRMLLEIRRSLGNKKTKLSELDMLRAMIKDIDSLQGQKRS